MGVVVVTLGLLVLNITFLIYKMIRHVRKKLRKRKASQLSSVKIMKTKIDKVKAKSNDVQSQ